MMKSVNRKITIPQSKSKGFTLIEVVITMFILAIGILGLAGMQAVGVKESQNSYFRTQADMLANDIVDRMRANLSASRDTGVDAYVIAANDEAGNQECAANCSAANMATYDLFQWRTAITNSSLPNASSAITRQAGEDIYTIDVIWDEDRDGNVAAACNPAGNDACIRLVVQI